MADNNKEEFNLDDKLEDEIKIEDEEQEAAADIEPLRIEGLEDEVEDDKGISHSPLHLGGKGTNVSANGGIGRKVVSDPDRITGVKTFFVKLHVGSMEYLDEQVSQWLKANPGIRIKHTNAVCGNIVGKKTEPNLIVTIWY